MKTRRKKTALQAADETEIAILDIMEAETVCAVCSAEFLDEEDLKLHVMQVHLHESNGKTICRFCYSIFCSQDEYVTHLVYRHLGLLNFCFFCFRAFLSTQDEHEQKHRAVVLNRSVTCSQCTRIFTNRKNLQEHEYIEHRDNEGVMLNGVFSLLSSAINIPIRKFLLILSKNRAFTCTVCKYSSHDLSAYINHLKMMDCRSYSCDKCYRVFKKKAGVLRHMLRSLYCQNTFRDQEQCTKCDKIIHVNDKTKHMATCFALKCPTCNVITNSMHDLTEHRAKEHNTPVSLEKCKFCKREFVGVLNLKKHIKRSHSNYHLYKYSCTHCDAIFVHPSKLFAHYFTKHKEIEPYTCKICNKNFRLRKQFTIHIKIIHKSVGFVEFDENLHVFFSDKESENPFKPTAEHLDISTDDSDDNSQFSDTEVIEQEIVTSVIEPTENADDQSSENTNQCLEISNQSSEITNQSTEISVQPEKNQSTEITDEQPTKPDADKSIEEITVTSQDTVSNMENDDSDDMNLLILKSDLSKTKPKGIKNIKRKRKVTKRPAKRLKKAPKSVEVSDDEPLSTVRVSLLKHNENETPLKSRLRIRNKRARLTCKICNKYCYTVQNFHHHMSLHENSKLKRCIKCHAKFRSKDELKNHIDNAHSSSKLTETLKSLLEKRKKTQPKDTDKPTTRPADFIKSLVEKRKKSLLMTAQNVAVNKFRKTIKKVDVTDNCKATITPMSDHGLSVKNFIENFRPDTSEMITVSNSVTIKTIDPPTDKQPLIKMKKFTQEEIITPGKLKFPVKFRDNMLETKYHVKVNLVQQLITKPKLVNMNMDERIPVMSPKPEYNNEYCNMFADETDYTQYKNDSIIPDVAQEVMLGDIDDIPRTKQLAQEIIIPNIPDKYGGVRIGHLLPDAPFFKIVKVKKLLKAESDSEPEEAPTDKNIKLPDGTQLVSVKNPFAHLIPNDHLEELLKANKNRYYTPKTKNIQKALAKALNSKPVIKTKIKRPAKKRGRKKKVVVETEQ
ncbi:uncharacterized protein [Epargyreus clarus]|uniref:uncharacterized protein n=1 Tax=Epargyreus clarus TaxID=520877 RepID=UPI003C3065B5